MLLLRPLGRVFGRARPTPTSPSHVQSPHENSASDQANSHVNPTTESLTVIMHVAPCGSCLGGRRCRRPAGLRLAAGGAEKIFSPTSAEVAWVAQASRPAAWLLLRALGTFCSSCRATLAGYDTKARPTEPMGKAGYRALGRSRIGRAAATILWYDSHGKGVKSEETTLMKIRNCVFSLGGER
jgi:hypothetical protein